MTRNRLIVGLITHIVMILTVMKPVREAKARLWSVALLMMMMMMMMMTILQKCMQAAQNTLVGHMWLWSGG
jgi:hypothetical protein